MAHVAGRANDRQPCYFGNPFAKPIARVMEVDVLNQKKDFSSSTGHVGGHLGKSGGTCS